jgi:hypothetical protein
MRLGRTRLSPSWRAPEADRLSPIGIKGLRRIVQR